MDLPLADLTIFHRSSTFMLGLDTSHFLRDILQTIEKNNLPGGVKVFANEVSVPIYQSFIDPTNLFRFVDKTKYSDIMSLRNSCLVFDNCFSDNSWMQDRMLRTIIQYPRSHSITSLFGFQQVPRFSPTIRHSVNIICIGADIDAQKLYDYFFQSYCSFDTLSALLDRYTNGNENENGFLIMRCDTIDTFEESLSYYCAKKIEI